MKRKYREKQEERENKDFGLFKQLCPQIPAGELRQNREQPKRPDFIVDCDNGESLGIEHEELFKYSLNDTKFSSQQEQWSLKNSVVQDALESVKDTIDPLYVTIWFRDNCNINTKQLSESLASFISKWYFQEHPSSQTFCYPEEIPEIHKIDIQHIPDLPDHYWIVPQSGWAKRGEHFIEDLGLFIKKKNVKHRDYIQNCSKCWLLIAFDKWNPSQMFEIGENTKEMLSNHYFYSPFEKVFLLERCDKKLIELKISN